jgi:hypothetical protein
VEVDGTYHQVWIDARTNAAAGDSTPLEQRRAITVLDLPIEAHDWARTQGYMLLTDFSSEPGLFAQGSLGQSSPLMLLSPQPNTLYRIDPTLDLTVQQLQIEVAANSDISQVKVWIDGTLFASMDVQPYITWWTLAPGEHRLWAEGVNVNGETVSSEVVTITVLSAQ